MRKIFDIPGGIHPPENKTQSLGEPIVDAGIPARLVVPLAQHIGAPAGAIVEPGQRVLKGQKIAEAKGFVSAPVHAPSSGTVIAVQAHKVPHPSGMKAPCIIIETDGEDEWIACEGIDDFTQLERQALLQRIREAGISGMGGAGFPSAVKLSVRDDKPIDTLIINGTECEPYITADHSLMRERAADIITGVKVLQHLIQPSEATLIGVEDNKPDAIEILQAACEGTSIEVVVFPTKYPSGGEKQLIQILTGREVPSGGLPADVGIVCQNVGTCAAIGDAITLGRPLISRVTTVTGEACERPRNYQALIGTPVRFLLEQSGFDAARCERLIMGGPMMGFSLPDIDVPIVKASNCLLAPAKTELPAPPPAQACIRCGLCAEACPASLLPQQMYWHARGQEFEKLEALNLFDCIECGACSYACPSNIPLVQYYRAAKSDIREMQQEKIKAEHSKARFEARKARIEREEAEKEARRKARAEAAKAKAAAAAAAKNTEAKPEVDDKAAKVDVVQAAIERAKAKKQAQAADAGKAAEASDASSASSSNSAPAASGDAAADAIARAKAKRDAVSDMSPQEKLEQNLTSLRKRKANAENKLKEAEQAGDDDKAEKLRSAVATAAEKITEAEQKLAALTSNDADAPERKAVEAEVEADPAAAAIARAMAAREAAANQSPAQKLKTDIEKLEKRIAGTEQKLKTAQEEGSEHVDILQSSLNKQSEKLEKLREQLSALGEDAS